MSELALLGGRKAKNKAFPEWPMYDDKERRALMDVLESRVWWRTPGTKTLEFEDRKSTRLNSSHVATSYAVFCLKKTRRLAVALAAGALLLAAGWIQQLHR